MKAGAHPLVIAHRGASASAPENTLAAFALAVAQDADGIELDVRATADNVLVIHHDPSIRGIGPIGAADFASLRTHAPKVPTLDEMLDVSGDLLIDVEIKNSSHDRNHDPTLRIADQVAAWVARNELYGRVIVSSIDWATAAHVAKLDPRIATGQVLVHRTGAAKLIQRTADAGHAWVLPSDALVGRNPEVAVELARKAGLRIGVWTVDKAARLQRLADAGVHAVITNDPAAAHQAVAGG
jgi:glycerophosphoryl diester phosphodiesterase